MDFITLEKAAELLGGVHVATVRRFIKAGRLKAYTVPGQGNRYFVDRAAVEKLGEPVPLDAALRAAASRDARRRK